MLITVAGEVDVATALQLREQLAGPAASGRPIIVDLDPVSFIDAIGPGSTGQRAVGRTATHGASLHVVCAQYQVRRLFTITAWTATYRLPARPGTAGFGLISRAGPAYAVPDGGAGRRSDGPGP